MASKRPNPDGPKLPSTWTTDLKTRKVRVNVISPGVAPPEGYRSLGDEKQVEQFAAQMATKIPLGREGEPDEIAKAVVFLASDESSFVAGAELVDGGMIAVYWTHLDFSRFQKRPSLQRSM